MSRSDGIVLCVIPARSGSRRVRDKNIRQLLGSPLLSYAIKSSRTAKTIDKVIVSTDSEVYAEIARRYGAEVPFLRPRELADDVPTEHVIKHAVRWVEENWGVKVSIVATVQCTSPFVEPSDIDRCVQALMEDLEADSSMTVTEVREHPAWTFYVEGKYLKPFLKVETKEEWGVSQMLPKLFIPNGMCYATRRDTLMLEGRIVGHRCVPVFVEKWRSVEIDEEMDFAIAERIGIELLLKSMGVK